MNEDGTVLENFQWIPDQTECLDLERRWAYLCVRSIQLERDSA